MKNWNEVIQDMNAEKGPQMTDKIIPFTGLYYGDEPAIDVLEKAKAWNAEAVLIVAQDAEGKLTVGANFSDMKDMVWMLQRAMWDMAKRESLND